MHIRLKRACTAIGQYGANISAGAYVPEGVRFLRTTDINEDGSLRDEEDSVCITESDAKGYILEPGDLLFSRSGSLGRSYLHREGAPGSHAFAGYLVRFRPSPHVHPPYLFYASRGASFQAQISADAIQTTISNFNGEKYGNLEIWLPSLETQRTIANFLDRKTAALDALIQKNERLIAALTERRSALIHRAVTNGLNPDVRMKDSGILWIGNIPAHWEMHQLRRVVREFVDYRGRTPDKSSSGVPLITAGAVRDGKIDHSRAPEWVSEETYELLSQRGGPEAGDLLFTSEAPLGEVGLVVDPRIACAQRIILFRLNRHRMSPEYLRLHFLAETGKGEMRSRASGSTAEGIRADRLKMSLVPTPPIGEQNDICAYVEAKTEGVNAVSGQAQVQLDRLHEYRQALITAAVTGQLDIGELSP